MVLLNQLIIILKNDSIVKRKGEDSIYIYRNGEVKAYKY